MKSWKTTTAGVAAIVTLWAGALNATFDSDPKTNPDWNTTVAMTLAALGLTSARDHKTSDEQAGAGQKK